MQISLFITCLTDVYRPRAGVAVVRVLEHLGHTVTFPDGQTCCGQPMRNNGFEPEARTLARRMLSVFADAPVVVTPSASCAAMVRAHYPGLFTPGTADRAAAEDLAGRTWEFAELLAVVLGVDPAALGWRCPGRATYHPSCHRRDLGPLDHAETLLRRIEGLELVPLAEADSCCGFGGTFAVSYPRISGTMVRDKVEHIRTTGADTVVSTDAGCTMNIAGACRRARCDARVTSLAELIAEGLGLLDREGS